MPFIATFPNPILTTSTPCCSADLGRQPEPALPGTIDFGSENSFISTQDFELHDLFAKTQAARDKRARL